MLQKGAKRPSTTQESMSLASNYPAISPTYREKEFNPDPFGPKESQALTMLKAKDNMKLLCL